ncbi:S8 family serine peptidase [Flavobacterium sp.]|uniref:S8 family serine peptidase n=1 Tax=Flavobacterium sp. TaxID=239 RepID=UPI002605B7AF|nr:S8 family serine peptidase [Flavobacterium sp.]MDD3005173.1 S8 family serine peptidase [Flavobacterium sp.]
MKRWIFIMLLFSSVWGYAQQDAWVYLTDKPDAATYLANPLTMLTQKSLDRRAAQNIALDVKDVPVFPSYLSQISNATGITVMAKSKWLNALHVRGSIENIQQLSSLTFVSSIEFADKTITATTTSSNTRSAAIQKVNKSLETQINYPYGNSANQISMLGGDLLHQQNYTGTGKTIAVLDAGFPGVNTAPAFQRLINNNLILGGYDFVNKSTNFYTGGAHGTLVLSTMGGYLADAIVGAAPDASYYLFITEDINNENPVEESYWVEAAEEADRLGVDIINTSLGYFHYDNPNYNYTYNDMNGVTSFVSRGADVAFSRGMICVTSAGNSGGTINPYISVPADAVHTLAIGAVIPNGTYASFSSIGPSADQRVKPDVVAQGVQAVVANPTGTIGTANGTSFSGPITAGMVACLWQALPTKTNAEMMQIIKQSAHIYNNPTPLIGYGIPNYNTALLNNLSAFEAITDFFLVYPNPVKDLLYIKNNKLDNNAQVELISVLGNIVAQQQLTVGENSIAVSHLPSGMYFCRFSSGKNQYVKTFIKL